MLFMAELDNYSFPSGKLDSTIAKRKILVDTSAIESKLDNLDNSKGLGEIASNIRDSSETLNNIFLIL